MTLTSLKLIGYWKSEDPDAGPAWPHPERLVDWNWHPESRERLIAYLRNAVRLAPYLGYSYCRFRGGPPDSLMGDAEMTDGVWVWPEGLVIYVEKYGVRLPEEFLTHAMHNKFQIPAGLDADVLGALPFDLSFWDDWCMREVPPKQKSPAHAFRSLWSRVLRGRGRGNGVRSH